MASEKNCTEFMSLYHDSVLKTKLHLPNRVRIILIQNEESPCVLITTGKTHRVE